MEFIELYC